jgi:hypothetical protein
VVLLIPTKADGWGSVSPSETTLIQAGKPAVCRTGPRVGREWYVAGEQSQLAGVVASEHKMLGVGLRAGGVSEKCSPVAWQLAVMLGQWVVELHPQLCSWLSCDSHHDAHTNRNTHVKASTCLVIHHDIQYRNQNHVNITLRKSMPNIPASDPTQSPSMLNPPDSHRSALTPAAAPAPSLPARLQSCPRVDQ